MREIKFRIPHYNRNGNFYKFSYWGNINHNGDFSKDCFSGKTSIAGTNRREDEQYTGLKDKNGKEIYEGDVVKWNVNDVTSTGAIVFEFGYFWMEKVYNDWLRGEYEIIGNIHSEVDNGQK